MMPMIVWLKYLLEAQGYAVTDNILHQESQSTMRLKKYGKASIGQRTGHIAICYFFVTDRVAASDLSVQYCPTEMMLADFYTKPLQCKVFRMFRSLILNIQSDELPELCEHMVLSIPYNMSVHTLFVPDTQTFSIPIPRV